MAPLSLWSQPKEWPKLDLPKDHLTHLALAWILPNSQEVAAAFGGLLSADGSFYGVLSYHRGRVRHYRIEAAQLGGEEGDRLTATVQYQADTGSLGVIPKFLQEGAWLLDGLMQVAFQDPILCNAGFLFRAAPTLQTAFPLPFQVPDAASRLEPIDEIRGIRGVKRGDLVSGYDYTFTLDRLEEGDISLNLEFSIASGPADGAPQRALASASFIARRLVFHRKS